MNHASRPVLSTDAVGGAAKTCWEITPVTSQIVSAALPANGMAHSGDYPSHFVACTKTPVDGNVESVVVGPDNRIYCRTRSTFLCKELQPLLAWSAMEPLSPAV